VSPRAGLDAVQYRKFSCPCRESDSGRPDRKLVAMLKELSRLCYTGILHKIICAILKARTSILLL
jgi:hypothetical protein